MKSFIARTFGSVHDSRNKHFDDLARKTFPAHVFVQLQHDLDMGYLRATMRSNFHHRDVGDIINAYFTARVDYSLHAPAIEKLEDMAQGWQDVTRIAMERNYTLPERVDLRKFNMYSALPDIIREKRFLE